MSEIWGDDGEPHGEFAWGPERDRRERASAFTTALTVAAVVLLVLGVVALVVHRKSTATPRRSLPPIAARTTTTTVASTTTTVPTGPRRVADSLDGISVVVPAGWQVLSLTPSTLRPSLQALQTSDPQMAPLVNTALNSLQESAHIGIFAADPAIPAQVYSYGIAPGSASTLSSFPSSKFVTLLKASGATDVKATQVHLPLGGGEQLSFQLGGTATISEFLDYFLYQGHLIFLAVAARGSSFPNTLVKAVEDSLTAA